MKLSHPIPRQLLALILAITLALITACLAPTATNPATQPAAGERLLLADFEKPNPAVTWVPTSASTQSQPATDPTTSTEPTPTLSRMAQRPDAGLWSLAVTLTEPGELRLTSDTTADLSRFDILSVQISHLATPDQNGAASAALALTDAAGKTVRGDAFPIKTKWSPLRFDLKKAFVEGLDTAHITTIALALEPTRPLAAPLQIQTDTWTAQTDSRSFLGTAAGKPKSFYVEQRGDRLHIGSVNQYDLYLWNAGTANRWLEIFPNSHEKQSLGQPATGLFLLDQPALEKIAALRQQSPDTTTTTAAGTLPDASWPAASAPTSFIQWNVVWTSPIGAIIEGRQEVGPYDRSGEPAVMLKWRLMIYQWGQLFVNVAWSKPGETQTSNPVSWALALDRTAIEPTNAAPTDRLLADIYTQPFRQNLATALPHSMQTDTPVAMIARASTKKDNYWWAADPRRHLFGTGLAAPTSTAPDASCMLLVNNPTALTKAGSFSQYLDPVRISMRQGELELTYPGDADNDGFVESYGFHAIRLTNGRATFTIFPQSRPIYYPVFLFTVPAADRDALNLKNSRLLINLDGKQFADPPVFPSGSFLLQLPYVLDRPVNVEAVLVRK